MESYLSKSVKYLIELTELIVRKTIDEADLRSDLSRKSSAITDDSIRQLIDESLVFTDLSDADFIETDFKNNLRK